jgi:hypothetical protein
MGGPLREEAEAVTQETDEVLELVEQLGDALHGGVQRSAERRPWFVPFVPGTSASAAKALRAFSAQDL